MHPLLRMPFLSMGVSGYGSEMWPGGAGKQCVGRLHVLLLASLLYCISSSLEHEPAWVSKIRTVSYFITTPELLRSGGRVVRCVWVELFLGVAVDRPGLWMFFGTQAVLGSGLELPSQHCTQPVMDRN